MKKQYSKTGRSILVARRKVEGTGHAETRGARRKAAGHDFSDLRRYHPRRLNIRPTSLPGVLIIEPKVFGDERGFFMETYRVDAFRAAGIPDAFVQDNHSRSARG